MDDASYTSYIIVGPQRSGTTVTHHCLRGHTQVSALQEELAFDPFFTDGLSAFTFGRPGTDAEQRTGRRHLFDALTAPGRDADTQACGVKCAFGHGRQGKRFVEVIREEFPDCKIIHVVRNDQVAQFGSRLKARSTNVYHQTDDAHTETTDAPTLHLDPHQFAEHMLAIHDLNDHLRRLVHSHDVLTIDYEADILRGDLRTNDTLFSFVNVEPEEATWLQHRKVSPSPETYISNYAALSDLQDEIEDKLDSGRSIEELRDEYAPPFLKALYQTGKHWIEHPGYGVQQIQNSIKEMFAPSQSEPSS